MADGSRLLVRFLTGNPPYNAGEVAGFAPAEAERLVSAGTAVYHNDPVLRALPAVKDVAAPPAHKMVTAPARSKAPTRGKTPAARPAASKRRK